MKTKTDRRRVMRDAHKRLKDGKRLGLGWTWSQCLKTAWAAERIRCSDTYQHTYARAA